MAATLAYPGRFLLVCYCISMKTFLLLRLYFSKYFSVAAEPHTLLTDQKSVSLSRFWEQQQKRHFHEWVTLPKVATSKNTLTAVIEVLSISFTYKKRNILLQCLLGVHQPVREQFVNSIQFVFVCVCLRESPPRTSVREQAVHELFVFVFVCKWFHTNILTGS